MKQLNSYILEKYKISKNTKLDKNYLIGEIYYEVKHCLEDDYKISTNNYTIYKVNEYKYIINTPEDTWHVVTEIRSYNKNENFINNILNSIKIRLKRIIEEENIKLIPLGDNKYQIRIYLYDPE